MITIMASRNRIATVAIVGAGGNCGRFITEALLRTGKHKVTAVTRDGSQTKLPQGVSVAKVDYSKPDSLVDALRGHDALVITLSGHSPKETEAQLVEAAAEAGVSWILPNEWSPDTANEALVKDVFIFQPKVKTREAISRLGKSSYISVCTGFWYEYTLAMPASFGIDLIKHTANLYDDGETKISVSTFPQIGRAVAALLSLPIQPEDTEKDGCLAHFRNKVVYINSFTVSQRDMLASAVRVTGTTEKDWTITEEPIKERYASGVREIQEGKRIGFAKMMYGRVFFPDGCGNFEQSKGTLNNLLGLPQEKIDEATKVAIERSNMPSWTEGGK